MQTTPPNWMLGTEAQQSPIITIRCYSFTRKPLFKLLKEAKALYERTRPQMITIRVLDMRGTWRKVAYKARRPLANIIMDSRVRDSLLEDAQEFLKSEDWYAARGLRWNRGYLLHGAPGTGKSSTIQALASELKLDVYIISINSPTMNDSVLASTMRSIPPKSIVVMEDVDAVFSTQKRDLSNGPAAPPRPPVGGMYPGMRMGFGMQSGSGGSISLSAGLNAIDGVESNEGRLLMMSTNVELSELDAALTRPGRVDMFINYKRATREQAEELFNIFYRPAQAEESDLEELVEDGVDSPTGPRSPQIKEASVLDEKSSPTASKRASHHPFELPSHVTQSKIAEWAKLWSAQIEDEQFTIAELQGMLLSYKKDPEAAMQDMPNWITKELARRAAEAEKERKRREEQKTQNEGAETTATPAQAEGAPAAARQEGKKEEEAKAEDAEKPVDLVNLGRVLKRGSLQDIVSAPTPRIPPNSNQP